MRLFHISEENNIDNFIPRIPVRTDLNKDVGLVWAINEECFPNFLTPRDCPRICYHVNANTTIEDIDKYIDSPYINHVIVIENKWFEIMKNTTLYIYEFDITNFELQDEVAGYYVSKKTEVPIAKYVVNGCFEELFKRNIEIKIVDDLHEYSKIIMKSSFSWSLCRMKNASSKKA